MDHLQRILGECEYRLDKTIFKIKVLESVKDAINNDATPLFSLWTAFTLSRGMRRAEEIVETMIKEERERIDTIKSQMDYARKWIVERAAKIEQMNKDQ